MASNITEEKDCSICCESYNKSTRSKVVCQYCGYSSCNTCNKTYLLGSFNEPHCSSCRKTWPIEFMNDNFTQSFLKNEYRANRETIYFKEEETHFPALLTVAELRKKLESLDTQIKSKKVELVKNNDNEDQLVKTQREIERAINVDLDKLEHTKRNLIHKDIVREKRVVEMKCPLGECKGFIDSKFFCGMCESHVCRDCHVKKLDTKDEEHKCNPDDVATVVELNRSTKPCPNCHTRIFKTDGCDQMFCVQCHTPFSWTTGRIETGVIHNPHYFEALRAGNIQHQRHQPHQGGCGVMRPASEVQAVIRLYNFQHKLIMEEKEQKALNVNVMSFYQRVVHHRAVTLAQFTRVANRDEERIKFLIGKTEEKKFKQRLYVDRKTAQRKIEEQQIMDTFVNIGEGVFREINSENVDQSFLQLKNLWKLTKEAIVLIDKKYQHKGILVPEML